jgi:cytochrome b561
MSRLPSHPGTDEEPSHTNPAERPSPRPWARILVVAVVVLLVAGMIVLHITGVVGPGSH